MTWGGNIFLTGCLPSIRIHTHSDIYVRTELAIFLLCDYLGQGFNEVLKTYLRDSGGINLRPTVL